MANNSSLADRKDPALEEVDDRTDDRTDGTDRKDLTLVDDLDDGMVVFFCNETARYST